MHAPRILVIGVAGLMLSAVLLAVATGVVSASLLEPGGGAGGEGSTPSSSASNEIPAAMLALYRAAAATCSGLPWTVVAAIGTIESGNGTSNLPGVHSGSNPAGAEGPMQFEPSTFSAYSTPVPPGGVSPPSPYDATDAVYAAVRMLCANGAASGTDLRAAIFAYNHSQAYVSQVLGLAASYGQSQSAGAGLAGENAVAWALAQVGTPYRWGGESPGVGFDCSGLVQAAFKAAGVALPRVAQNQFDVGPRLAPGMPLDAGDLVFFGGGPAEVEHVGLYIGVQNGQAVMVDAPHTGAVVRVEPFPTTIGARFGGEEFVGATRPSA